MSDTDDSTGEPESRPRPRRGSRDDISAQLKFRRAEIERQVRATRAQFDEANSRIEERAGRNLVKATLIGLGLGLVMLFSLIVVKEIFVLFGAAVVAFTVFELVHAFRQAGRAVDVWPAVVSSVAIVASGYFLDPAARWSVLVGAIVFIAAWRLVAQMAHPAPRRKLDVVRDLAAAVFVQVYVSFLASFAMTLVRQPEGEWWALAFLIIVIAVDIGAYASGLNFGKHPMAPLISPKKTWEGFAGAALAAVVAGILLSVFMLNNTWWVGLILGLALLGTATMGDLTESLIKRDLGIKDMSSWLPGHGGFLDRLDSILPSAPIAFGLFLLFSGAPIAG
ncbi:phosphatidate cytidylyltransferase [Mycetocola sp. CAN_C7]|uniref:phosphatidate cytidylyltransferase n=1 Tax=Mycetocola sp. CAN_C7 TaxID=2787724 RepID=UPI001A1FA6B8